MAKFMANYSIKNKNANKFYNFLNSVARARFGGRADKTQAEIEQMKKEYIAKEMAKIEKMPLWCHDIFDEMLKKEGQIEKVANVSGDSYFKKGGDFPNLNLETLFEAERADLISEDGRPFDMFLQEILYGHILPKNPTKAEKNYFKKYPEEKKAIANKIKSANQDAKAEFNKVNLATQHKLNSRKNRKNTLQPIVDTYLKGLKGTPDYKIQSALFKRFKSEDKKLLKAEAKFDKVNAEMKKQQKLFEQGAIKTLKGQKAYEKATQAYEKQSRYFERLKNDYVTAYLSEVNKTDEKLAEQYALRIHQIRTGDFSYTPLKGFEDCYERGCLPTAIYKVNDVNVKPVFNEFIKSPIFGEMKMPVKNQAEEEIANKEVVDIAKLLKKTDQNVATNEKDENKQLFDKINDFVEKAKVNDIAQKLEISENKESINNRSEEKDVKDDPIKEDEIGER